MNKQMQIDYVCPDCQTENSLNSTELVGMQLKRCLQCKVDLAIKWEVETKVKVTKISFGEAQ